MQGRSLGLPRGALNTQLHSAIYRRTFQITHNFFEVAKKRRAMASSSAFSLSLVVVVLLWLPTSLAADAYSHHDHWSAPLVSKEKRKTIASSDYGSVSAVDVSDGYKQLYHLQFFTLEPQSLLTPLYLHTDMVFYVHSGRGTIDWVGDGETKSVEVKRGDIYRIPAGSVFYVHSHPDPQRQKLRIHAIFTTPTSDSSGEQFARAYSNLADLIRGFDKQVLRMGFKVPEEVISALKRAERPPAIVPFIGGKPAGDGPGWKEGIFEALLGTGLPLGDDNKKKKDKKSKEKAFNILEAKPDVQNCNGQSIAVTAKEFSVLRGSDVGVFMVNLTKGSMVGPHWNPRATEVAVVTEGEGMVQVVLPTEKKASSPGEEGEEGACESWRVRVREGDVFVVPRYHAMAQMSFNDGSFSWVGFSTSVRRNRPQFLAGKRSVLQILDKDVLALALGVSNKTVEKLLAAQGEAVMLECTSCAEEAERTGEEEERQREEKEEEEKRRREEEEARKREEEEARKREEEERKRKEEEEERKREEEEEERKRKEEEEERKREEEEEERKREEEEEERKRKEEEEGGGGEGGLAVLVLRPLPGQRGDLLGRHLRTQAGPYCMHHHRCYLVVVQIVKQAVRPRYDHVSRRHRESIHLMNPHSDQFHEQIQPRIIQI
ncbi:vicilin-like seed storage protein At4g36700 [Wolffia australiana]